MQKRSTQTNLVDYVHFLSNAFNANSQVDAIYTDFSKAFDKVSHKLLIYKLENHGISGNVLKWLKSYLFERHQRVVVDGGSSGWRPVTSGVPQGSLLGPLLFVIYVNDMPSSCNNSFLSMYADDAKIFRFINSVQDCVLLQDDLTRLNNWCKTWRLVLNISKCCSISFTNKRKPIYFEYVIGQEVVDKVNKVKDLGVLLTHNLSFNEHISNTVNRAFRMLGFVKRSCKSFSLISSLKSLLTSEVYLSMDRLSGALGKNNRLINRKGSSQSD